MDFGNVSYDLSFLSSIAIIVGSLFIIVQLRQNNQLIRAANEQAAAAGDQAKLTTDQLKQNHELANMDLIMRLYEFANSKEVQSAWLTVLNSKVNSFDEFLRLEKGEQVAFFQIGALFESLGVLVEKGFVKLDMIEDMFLTGLAWKAMEPFVSGMRTRYGEEEHYIAFERLHGKIDKVDSG